MNFIVEPASSAAFFELSKLDSIDLRGKQVRVVRLRTGMYRIEGLDDGMDLVGLKMDYRLDIKSYEPEGLTPADQQMNNIVRELSRRLDRSETILQEGPGRHLIGAWNCIGGVNYQLYKCSLGQVAGTYKWFDVFSEANNCFEGSPCEPLEV